MRVAAAVGATVLAVLGLLNWQLIILALAATAFVLAVIALVQLGRQAVVLDRLVEAQEKAAKQLGNNLELGGD